MSLTIYKNALRSLSPTFIGAILTNGTRFVLFAQGFSAILVLVVGAYLIKPFGRLRNSLDPANNFPITSKQMFHASC
jgi:hypothetical protein